MMPRQYTNIRGEEKIFRCRLLFLLLVQTWRCARIHQNKGRVSLGPALEKEFQSKLNQPRICPSRRTCYHPEIRIVCRAADHVWRRELRPIKDVEELRPEFQSQPFIAPKPRPLKYCKVEVTDSLSSQPGVYPWLVSENEIGRRRKTCRIEPFRNRRGGTPRHCAYAAGNYVRA